jgi:hypothetical protein
MRILILLLVACSALHADVVADLKKTLARLNGHEPIKARVIYEFSNRNGDDDKPVIEEANIIVQVTDSPDGLTVLWPRKLTDAAASELKTSDEDSNKKHSIGRAMDALSATALNDFLNAGPRLERLLEKSELLSEGSELWQGQPAHLLTFKITPKLPKYVKVLEQTVKLWLGADGIPLAAESRTLAKGRALLVISFESTEAEDWRFAHVGQRLVVTHHTKENQGSGGGEKGSRKTSASIDLISTE